MMTHMRVSPARRALPGGTVGRLATIASSTMVALALSGPWTPVAAAEPVQLKATLTATTWNRAASATGSGQGVVEINAERTRMIYRITYQGVAADIVEVFICAGVGTNFGPDASIPPDEPHYCAILASTWLGGPSPIVGSGPINYTKADAPDPRAVLALVSGTAYMRLMSRQGPELEGRLLLAAPRTDTVTPGSTAGPWSIPILVGIAAFVVVIRRRWQRSAREGRR